ncbi:low-density lipoprotein receptor-related protein 2-like [Patiria miniata]|uniref:Uncharacterized protein n=1 Tax=Patiria miniata TaxID=46514 RepID=A0A914BAV7_PATMI|nr:low-density lipoprotein receptor-related protein 2-like [Patiria miniata]
MLRLLTTSLLIGAIFDFAIAGDFALVADLENGTISAGSMSRSLSDLTPLHLSGVARPVAVGYDPVEGMVYWSDISTSLPSPKISRANLDGSKQETIVDNLYQPDGLALNIQSRMIYWTDYIGHIGRAHLNGSGGMNIIESLDQPRAIIVNDERRHIYWANWGDNPKIDRADLDGNNRTLLVEGDLLWLNGIAIDFEANYLYWCDARLDKIERSDLSGNHRTILLDIQSYPGIHPFGLALYKNSLYWTDWKSGTLHRIHVNGSDIVYARDIERFGPDSFLQGAGIHIQEEPSHCEHSPCNFGATCADVFNSFSCHCAPDFHGQTCAYPDSGCLAPPVSSHVTLVQAGVLVFSPGQEVTFVCDNGFSVAGTTDHLARRVCRADGTWSGIPLECSPDSEVVVNSCRLPTDSSDGLVVLSGEQSVYLPGDLVEYACPDGYHLSGSAIRTCRSDFTWSGQPAECILSDSGVGSCMAPPLANHVKLVEPDSPMFQPGEEATFTCDGGYIVAGSTDGSARRVCRDDGSWSGQPVVCSLEETGEGDAPVHVWLILSGVLVSSLLLFAIIVATVRVRAKRTATICMVERSAGTGRPDRVTLTAHETCLNDPMRVGEDNPEPIYEASIPSTNLRRDCESVTTPMHNDLPVASPQPRPLPPPPPTTPSIPQQTPQPSPPEFEAQLTNPIPNSGPGYERSILGAGVHHSYYRPASSYDASLPSVSQPTVASNLPKETNGCEPAVGTADHRYETSILPPVVQHTYYHP